MSHLSSTLSSRPDHILLSLQFMQKNENRNRSNKTPTFFPTWGSSILSSMYKYADKMSHLQIFRQRCLINQKQLKSKRSLLTFFTVSSGRGYPSFLQLALLSFGIEIFSSGCLPSCTGRCSRVSVTHAPRLTPPGSGERRTFARAARLA